MITSPDLSTNLVRRLVLILRIDPILAFTSYGIYWGTDKSEKVLHRVCKHMSPLNFHWRLHVGNYKLFLDRNSGTFNLQIIESAEPP